MKKVVLKWVAGNSAMPVLGESFKSFYNVFSKREDLEVSYIILYNGEDFTDFKKRHSNQFPHAELIDQHTFDFKEFPIPVKGCLWKEFPKIKMYDDAYEIYIDIDIILVNCKEIFKWIDSPIKTFLLYKNDSDLVGYNKGPLDAKPYVDKTRVVNGVSQLNADLCAGFYGTPPNISVNKTFNRSILDLVEDNSLWSDPKAKGYGSDQGIFCYFVSKFSIENTNVPFFILSYERHPFFSVTKGWISKGINFNNVEFLHVTGATTDYRSDRKCDFKLYNYIIKKIKKFKCNKTKTINSKNIKDLDLEKITKSQITGSTDVIQSKEYPLVLKIILRVLFKIFRRIFTFGEIFNKALNGVELGQYEFSLYLDIKTNDNVLLFSIPIDIKNKQFSFNPRIYWDGPVKAIFRENDRLILTKIID